MIKVNDTWLRILLVLVPSSLFLLDTLSAPGGTLQAWVIYTLTALLVSEGSRLLVGRSRAWFRGPHKKRQRLWVLLPAGVAWVTFCIAGGKALRAYLTSEASIITGGFTLHLNDRQIQLGLVGSSFLNALLAFSILFWAYELAHHFARSRHTEKERDRLEKEKLLAELQQLKGIVNPHFLFNNLNSLSALISENPPGAEAFLDELTKVFRYLLRNNETELTTLDRELQFLQSYFHLLETRYGSAISMDVNIDLACATFLLPPLTLQLLVENAVKHNRVQKEAPLRIEVFSEAHHRLVVRNNLAARQQKSESTGIGLRNINSRYALLGHTLPVIRQDAEHFSVVIPLIPVSDAQEVQKEAALGG